MMGSMTTRFFLQMKILLIPFFPVILLGSIIGKVLAPAKETPDRTSLLGGDPSERATTDFEPLESTKL